jgi:hypothetical protein
MPIIDLPVSDLAQDPIGRSRPRLGPDRVCYYVEHLDGSAPVVVFNINGRLLLADGHHAVPQPDSLASQR